MKSRFLLLLAILLLAKSAMAKEYEQDPFHDNDFTNPEILLDKAHATQKRLELGLNFNTSMVEKYTHHNGLIATIGWHFHDTFALELYGGYMWGKYNSMYQKVIEEGANGAGTSRNPNLPNRELTTWVTDLVLIWTPIYGKINLVSELAINGNVYFLLGAGVNGAKTIDFTGTTQPEGVKFNFQWGVGGRLYITKWMALRLEYRDLDYIGSWSSNYARTKTTPDYKYVTMNHLFQIGLSFFPF